MNEDVLDAEEQNLEYESSDSEMSSTFLSSHRRNGKFQAHKMSRSPGSMIYQARTRDSSIKPTPLIQATKAEGKNVEVLGHLGENILPQK